MLRKIIDFLNKETKEVEIPNGYVVCPDCDGTGHDGIFTDCEKCNREGIIKVS